MAHVTVKINGYTYTVGCEDGQERHLTAMAEQVDSRIEGIKALGSSSGEARLLVLAALLMADELHDMRVEIDGLRESGAKPGKAGRGDADASSRRISRLAARAEQIVAELDRP
ncbi:MAG: cell division protein ZapA [Rhodospirillales bacterium]|nr:cell division protein ZapA [Rhodospirillales bacterium]MDE2199291.1 cell division protein ZapA [Rhodospirillales bacterium]MDE2575356.1 cell division protein ZapA [Rhodospirillales bacterium]